MVLSSFYSSSTTIRHAALSLSSPKSTSPLLGFSLDLNFAASSSSSSSFKSDKRGSSSSLTCKASIEAPSASIKNEDVAVHGVSEKIVGVLGGGQLGRMLCQAASETAIKVAVLDPSENCPASSLSYQHMVGSFDEGATVEEFAKRINIFRKYKLATAFNGRLVIPLPEFMQIDDLESAKRSGQLFGYPLMVKSKRLAYDGRGNAVAMCEEDLSSAVTTLGGYERGLYAEKWAPFVKVPAVIPWKIRKLATDVACKAVSSLEGSGVFAVELFLTEDGQILLNEVSPRPHNSGHHTIECCYTSHFEQHLRAVVGLPLGDPSMKTPAAIMYNILRENEGERGFFLAHQLLRRALSVSGASVHWYDQSDATSPRIGIIMGSDSDLPVMKDAAHILNMLGVPHEVRIVSAHRTPQMMFSYAMAARERGVQVIIAGAGMVAALTPLPLIGVPVRGSSLDGLDSLLSIAQMPRGIPVVTVAINNATNAGLLAVRILGASDSDLQDRMAQYLEDARDDVLVKEERLQKDGWETYLNN